MCFLLEKEYIKANVCQLFIRDPLSFLCGRAGTWSLLSKAGFIPCSNKFPQGVEVKAIYFHYCWVVDEAENPLRVLLFGFKNLPWSERNIQCYLYEIVLNVWPD